MSKFEGMRKDAKQFCENIEVFANRRHVDVDVEYGGAHPKLIFTDKDGKRRTYGIPATASDHRSFENARHDIKRIFALAQWEVPINGDAPFSPSERIEEAKKEISLKVNGMTPPPLSRPDAVHVRGWEVPEIPEIAKGSHGKGGRKPNGYSDFIATRTHWTEVCRRAGADWEEIVEALAKCGHETTEGALFQALKKSAAGANIKQSVRSRIAPVNVDVLKGKVWDMIDEIVSKRVAAAEAERDAALEAAMEAEAERDDLRRKLEAFRAALKDV